MLLIPQKTPARCEKSSWEIVIAYIKCIHKLKTEKMSFWVRIGDAIDLSGSPKPNAAFGEFKGDPKPWLAPIGSLRHGPRRDRVEKKQKLGVPMVAKWWSESRAFCRASGHHCSTRQATCASLLNNCFILPQLSAPRLLLLLSCPNRGCPGLTQ